MNSKTLEKYKIYAQIDEVVHFVRKVDEGMYFGTGTSLGVINANEDVILEVFLNSSDKAKVSVGNHVSLTVDGLIQNEYGTVSGTLTKIDSDSTYTENGYFYKGIIKLDCQEINSKKHCYIYSGSSI